MMKRHTRKIPWSYNLAVELAVRIQDTLETNEDYPPYEYLPEAVTIVDRLFHDGQETDIATLVATVMSEALEYNYSPDNFRELVPFMQQRLKWLQKYSVD